MTVDPLAQALHYKSTVGGILTAEEREHLTRWYAEMDKEEEVMLAAARPPSADLGQLRRQVDEVLAQIIATAQKIKIQEDENERVRREIDSLKRTLAQKMMAQPA